MVNEFNRVLNSKESDNESNESKRALSNPAIISLEKNTLKIANEKPL